MTMANNEQLKNKIDLDIKKYRRWRVIRIILLITITLLFFISTCDLICEVLDYYNTIFTGLWFFSIRGAMYHICYHCFGFFDSSIINLIFAPVFTNGFYIPLFFIIKSKSGLPVKVKKKPTIDELRYIFLEYERNELSRKEKYIEEYEREVNGIR